MRSLFVSLILHWIKPLAALRYSSGGVKDCGSRMLKAESLSCPLRVVQVKGFEGRANDVIYCHPLDKEPHSSAVIYFGGDVQDYPENMDHHRDNKNYMKWNLENMALLLQSKFPYSHIVVIKPSRLTTHKLATFMDLVSAEMDQFRMEFKAFSCFDNFVRCNNCGAPVHIPTHQALQHLEQLLQTLTNRIKDAAQPLREGSCNNSFFPNGFSLDKAELQLIGFSKGCVVLNQFLYEFHYLKTLTPEDESMTSIVSRITDMYWLDGGHAGGKNTWITSRSLLETLTRLGIKIHIHVTPYQVTDERRPWIRKEEKAFGDLLKRLGAPVERTVHFENQMANLYMHFNVLSAFKQSSE
uniref:Uncharacterized protein n=1 Tax=Clastoptera arizonana TaxID=38151 RepID=A0A1B6E7C1_9HEMI